MAPFGAAVEPDPAAMSPRSAERLGLPLGGTPLVPLDVRIGPSAVRLLLKLEGFNPCGSMKDRTAMALVSSVTDRVTGGSGLIESSSGNLGAALAAVCAERDVPLTVVVDPKTSSHLSCGCAA